MQRQFDFETLQAAVVGEPQAKPFHRKEREGRKGKSKAKPTTEALRHGEDFF
jgi:hypothetical protein